MALWNKEAVLSEFDGKAGEPAKVVKEKFGFADLATVDDEMRGTAVDWIKAHAKDGNPFFIYLNFEKCHNPNNPSPRWKGKSPGGGTYLDALMEADDNSGQVLQAIRDAGIAENTLVVWTTDNGAWVDAWPDAGYTPFRGEKGSSYEGGFRVPALAWWPGHIKPGSINMDMWSHMDWWPTIGKLAGLTPPPHDWKDNNGSPNAKDTWLGPELGLKIPALYDLWQDPGEQYDIVFNGAAPTAGELKTSPGRYSGQDNGWIGLYITPVTDQFWGEMKTHPNIPYKPFGAGSFLSIPEQYR